MINKRMDIDELFENLIDIVKGIQEKCSEDMITCKECPLSYGEMCSLHTELMEEVENYEYDKMREEGVSIKITYDGEDEIGKTYLNNVDEVANDINGKIDEMIGSIVDVYGDVIQETKKDIEGDIERYTFFFTPAGELIPVAMFGIQFNNAECSIELRDIWDLGGRM